MSPSTRYVDGTTVEYEPPRDTMDPRYAACTDHHPACDCREALFAEDRSEFLAAIKEAKDAAERVLVGHPVLVFSEAGDGMDKVGCMCTGCQIARAANLVPWSSQYIGHTGRHP